MGDDQQAVAFEIGGLFFAITGGMTRYFQATVERLGLTEAQGRLLVLLREAARMSSLAEQLGCDASNVTGLVDRLEARGLVRRIADSEDRRIRLVELTAEGHQLLRQLDTVLAAERPSVLGLSESDQRELIRLLRLVHHLEEARAGDQPGTERNGTAG